MWHVYILKCVDESVYVGIAKDVRKRFEAHQTGKGAKYTRCRRPLELLYYEKQSNQKKAMRRELQIKKWPRAKKLALVIKKRRRAKKRAPARIKGSKTLTRT